MPVAPAPFHLLRNHSAPVSAVHINPPNALLYTGDQNGFVGITDLSSRRVIRFWQAHTGGILSLEEWDGHLIRRVLVCVIRHGRDHKVRMYERLKLAGRLGQVGDKSAGPPVLRELDVNALNFCRFAIASLEDLDEAANNGKRKEKEGILVVPSLLDSECADVYHLPSLKRLHSSFNYVEELKTPGASSSRTGLIMSLHASLRQLSDGASSLKVAMGYEDGRIELWVLAGGFDWKTPSDGRTGMTPWQRRYEGKKHNEAVMAMITDPTLTRAWTVSADHLLISYDLVTPASQSIKSWSNGHVGHASLALSPDGNVLAVGGWDGRVRLFSAATGKPLGDLAYHRETVQALCFAHLPSAPEELAREGEQDSTIELGEEDSEEENGVADGAPPRERWLISGGKDRRVAFWGLIDFTKVHIN